MNRAVSNLADRKELLRVLQGKRWYRQKGTGTRKLCWAKKMDWLSQGYFPYRGCQGSIKQITEYWSGGSWLIGTYPRFNFWENCKSWFADVGFITLTTPFWAYCLVLNMMTDLTSRVLALNTLLSSPSCAPPRCPFTLSIFSRSGSISSLPTHDRTFWDLLCLRKLLLCQ